MKQKSSLDIAKFLCAIIVLIIHADPFGSYSKILLFGYRNIISIVAVPFFFATSGYLLAQKLNALASPGEKGAYMKKYFKRLAVIYLVWSAVYFPFVILNWLRAGFTPMLVLEYVRDFFFEGSYSTIWFLPALMSAVLFYWLLRKKLSSKKIFMIGCGIYVITLLLSSYYGVTARVPGLAQLGQLYYGFFDSVKNGLLFGLVFISLGAMICEGNLLAKIKRFHSIVGIAVCMVLLCAEVVFYQKIIGKHEGVDTVVMILPLTVFTMVFALSFNVQPSKLCLTLRKLSMLIFLTQRIPISVIDLFMEESVVATNSLVNFAAVTVSTFAISTLILLLSKKMKWLKKIY